MREKKGFTLTAMKAISRLLGTSALVFFVFGQMQTYSFAEDRAEDNQKFHKEIQHKKSMGGQNYGDNRAEATALNNDYKNSDSTAGEVSVRVPCEQENPLAAINNQLNQNPLASTVPCDLGMRKCRAAKKDIKDKISNISINSGYTNRLKGRPRPPAGAGVMDTYLWGLINGKELNLNAATSLNPNQGSKRYPPLGGGIPDSGKICNPADGQTGNQCGKMIDVSDGSARESFTDGEAERSYVRGAFIQALKCYTAQVKREIDLGKLTVTSAANKGAARDLNSLYGGTKKLSNYVKQTALQAARSIQESKLKADTEVLGATLCNAADLGEGKADGVKTTENCASSEKLSEMVQDKELFTRLLKHRQSACYLRATRDATEASFASLAVSEIFRRATRHHEMVFVTGGKYSVYNFALGQSVNNPCVDKQESCDKHMKKVPPDPQAAYDCAIDKYTDCYEEKLPNFTRSFVSGQFDNNGICGGTGVIYPAIGALGGGRAPTSVTSPLKQKGRSRK